MKETNKEIAESDDDIEDTNDVSAIHQYFWWIIIVVVLVVILFTARALGTF
jgi:hypothetical protein